MDPQLRETLARIRRAAAREGDRTPRAKEVAEAIRAAGGYRWVGLYDVLSDEIAAVAWSGPDAPAHPRFPRERGLCGAAAASGRTVIVSDVRADPRYLTTLCSTRSEIVVPVTRGGDVCGLLDVESERLDAFDEADRRLLESCAAAAAALWT